jgi:AraC-like DNA-binding protein/mannose-6-phosphate isomerase-like protein (cupin superfamily)
MSRTGQNPAPLSPRVAHLEAAPQPVVAHRLDLPLGETIPRHRHRRAQLAYAASGVMTVGTDDGAFVAPPQRAVWIPDGVPHRIDARTAVAIRTVYVEPAAAPGLPAEVCVLQVTPLLRELVIAAMAADPAYRPGSAEERLMRVILDQIRVLPSAPLALPVPRDPRLRRLTDALMADPGDPRSLEDWAGAVGASVRTLTRLFEAQTRMSFRAWRTQLRLLAALEMLAAGRGVTEVSIEVGYESASAFTAMFRRSLGTTPTAYFAANG